jgi:uracil DNA glycosylase
MQVYVASSLRNFYRVRQIQQKFRDAGHIITYDWTQHCQVYSPEELRKYGEAEKQGVLDCDVFFMVHPARHGSHVELGYAELSGKLIIMLAEEEIEEKTFYHLNSINRFTNEQEALDFALSYQK